MDEAFRVLVVDDEKDFVETLVKRLKGRGIEAVGITSGEQALELMMQSPFDVVILDIRMPGMDGISALREMKRVQPRTEVILLTGHATVETALAAVKAGAYDYLTKPFDDVEVVARAVHKAAERKQLFDRKAIAYAMPDVCRACGFSETLRIGRLAAAHGVQLTPHLIHEISIHVVGALANGFLVEFMDWAPPDLWEDQPACQDGVLRIPDRPGHGMTLARGAIEKYRTR